MNNPSVRAGLLAAAAFAMTATAAQAVPRYHGFQGEGPGYVRDVDLKGEALAPSAEQIRLVNERGLAVRWSRFGTVKSMLKVNGFLSEASSAGPEEIARDFLRSNASLIGIAEDAVSEMAMIRLSPMYESPDYRRMLQGLPVDKSDVPFVVLLRQNFAGVPAAGPDGLVTVGVARDGRVAYVGSTLTPDRGLNGRERVPAMDAVAIAAADAGLELGSLSPVTSSIEEFSAFASDIVNDVQRVRLRAMPTTRDGVRLVHEVILLDSSHDRGHPQAFVSLIDAETGAVWSRSNKVDHFSDLSGGVRAKAATAGTYDVSLPAGECSDLAPFTVEGTDNGVVTVSAAVTSANTDDDITINLFYEGDRVANFDLLTQPEVLVYQPPGGVPPGEYGIQVCPFQPTQGAMTASGTYTATPGVSAEVLASPAWRVFPSAPVPNFGEVEGLSAGDDIRQLWCWEELDGDDDGTEGRDPATCGGPELRNIGSRVPWDALADGTPTYTTLGNNASTANSNISPLTPDTAFVRPVSADRTYAFEFTDAWAESQCDPTVFFDPTRNFADVEAATVNLFAMHNRMHDWSYLLGFTEVNSNLQFDNYGNTGLGGSTVIVREGDGELGSSQAGRQVQGASAGDLGVAGRNNANQITLYDGVPGITNQYLWQAWPGIIYPPACVDGAYEMSIIGHEYTHAISNRMTGGPDGDLGSGQDGRMGEAWSDLAAIEYQLSYGLIPPGSGNPFSAAPYVTGDLEAGIRNYGINNNPLNYSDLEYDGNGTGSPHADSEVWGGTHYDIRQALIDKYQAQYPYEDRELQVKCADGLISSEACPGNRRWLQLMFDGFLLQPTGPSMLDARDAIIAADMMRYDGANQFELWDAFAGRGMGIDAFTTGAGDMNPTPGFASPLREDNAIITFKASDTSGNPVDAARFYVGHHEARVTPVADTDPGSNRINDRAKFVPGTYDFIVQADGYGLHRFTVQIEAGQDGTLTFPLRLNLASAANGAKASGDGDTDEEGLHLIDDTEATNWESTVSDGTASEGKGEGAFVEGRQATVKLAQPALVKSVQVSAALHPGGQSRFTALRSFDILACDETVADCESDAGYTTIYESADDAFPGGALRPKVPQLIIRGFDVQDAVASHVRIVVRDNQCTGGPLYQREANPSGDPDNDPDCDTGSNFRLETGGIVGANPEHVRISELQVFAEDAPVVAVFGAARAVDAPERGNLLGGARGGALGWFVLLLGLSPLLRRRRQH